MPPASLVTGLLAAGLLQGVLQGGGRPWGGASRAAGRRICLGQQRADAHRRPPAAARRSTREAAQSLGLAHNPGRHLAAAVLLMDLHQCHTNVIV